LKSLSYTEAIIIRLLAQKMTGNEIELVMGEIAKEARVSRSNAVVLLSKLSAAGILESRSMGMKGMHIKVINREAFDEILKEVS